MYIRFAISTKTDAVGARRGRLLLLLLLFISRTRFRVPHHVELGQVGVSVSARARILTGDRTQTRGRVTVCMSGAIPKGNTVQNAFFLRKRMFFFFLRFLVEYTYNIATVNRLRIYSCKPVIPEGVDENAFLSGRPIHLVLRLRVFAPGLVQY